MLCKSEVKPDRIINVELEWDIGLLSCEKNHLELTPTDNTTDRPRHMHS